MKFNEQIKKDLFEYLAIENNNKNNIKEAIKYLEDNYFESVYNWHDDNYYNEYNYGLLFGLCGLNGQYQNETEQFFKDFFEMIIF